MHNTHNHSQSHEPPSRAPPGQSRGFPTPPQARDKPLPRNLWGAGSQKFCGRVACLTRREMVPSLSTRSLLGLVVAMCKHGETSSGDPVIHGSPPVRRGHGGPESDREREKERAGAGLATRTLGPLAPAVTPTLDLEQETLLCGNTSVYLVCARASTRAPLRSSINRRRKGDRGNEKHYSLLHLGCLGGLGGSWGLL